MDILKQPLITEKISAMNEKGVYGFIVEKTAKKPEIKNVENSGEKKRAFYILCSYYHPDKVNASKYGKKYKVLCEEISKRINEKFGALSRG